MRKAKSVCISKRMIWEAYKQVKAQCKVANVDDNAIKEFEADLENNLYRLWNRLASGTYVPPLLQAEIPTDDEVTRKLWVPTISDRIAQTLTAVLDKEVENPHTDAQYGALWSSMKPLQQHICLRIARGGDVTSADARREYALGSGKLVISSYAVNDALRRMFELHVLTKSSGGRGRYCIDDPSFAKWIQRERAKLLESDNRAESG